MQNKIVLSAVLLACLWALSGCSGFSSSTADLMRPPRLTPEQSAINEALTAAALTQTYTLKYPKSGEYRSAFVFHDIDGDGVEEAIAFMNRISTIRRVLSCLTARAASGRPRAIWQARDRMWSLLRLPT